MVTAPRDRPPAAPVRCRAGEERWPLASDRRPRPGAALDRRRPAFRPCHPGTAVRRHDDHRAVPVPGPTRWRGREADQYRSDAQTSEGRSQRLGIDQGGATAGPAVHDRWPHRVPAERDGLPRDHRTRVTRRPPVRRDTWSATPTRGTARRPRETSGDHGRQASDAGPARARGRHRCRHRGPRRRVVAAAQDVSIRPAGRVSRRCRRAGHVRHRVHRARSRLLRLLPAWLVRR